MKILLLTAEFATYEAACRASYACNYGLEDAFHALGIEVVTLPLFGVHDPLPVQWDRHLTEICAGHRFDQVWFEVCHSHFTEELCERFRELAPVRVGVVWETMRAAAYERATSPVQSGKKDRNFQRKVPLATHLIAVDSSDVEDFERFLGIPSFWTEPTFINQAFIKPEDPEPTTNQALFYGTAYGHRKSWLEHPALKPLFHRPDSPEWKTAVPKNYDQLIQNAALESKRGVFSLESFSRTVRQMRKLRRLGFELWLEGLQQGIAVVNLPQIGSTLYAGRVIESMAAGRVALTPEIAERPRNHALFQEGAEIFHYPVNHPNRLAEIIRRLQKDPDLRRETGLRAKQAIVERHTTERFVARVLKAIAEGSRPPAPSAPDPATIPPDTAAGVLALIGLARDGNRIVPAAAAAPGGPSAPAAPLSLALREILRPRTPLPSAEIASFGAWERNRWLSHQATTIFPGSDLVELVLDGESHRQFFDKCVCTSRPLQQAPVPASEASRYDIVTAVEVLPRLPEPAALLSEAALLLKPGGRLLLTAAYSPSLDSGTFFYGGFTPEWYRHFFRKHRLCILEMRPNGGFFRWLSRQLPATAALWTPHEERYGPHRAEIKELLAELLPAYLFDLETRLCDHRLTTGYFVQAIKLDSLELADAFIAANPDFHEIYHLAADLAEAVGQTDRMRGYLQKILRKEPDHREVKKRLEGR